MRYLGIIALDCVAYTMMQHLCQTNRSFVSDSGLTLERYATIGGDCFDIGVGLDIGIDIGIVVDIGIDMSRCLYIP